MGIDPTVSAANESEAFDPVDNRSAPVGAACSRDNLYRGHEPLPQERNVQSSTNGIKTAANLGINRCDVVRRQTNGPGLASSMAPPVMRG